MTELWKPLPQYDNCYEVSNFGRVRSIDRFVKGKAGCVQFKRGRILKPKINKNGYCVVHIRHSGNNTHPLIHRLVASVFLPKDYCLEQVNHKDGNKQNNCVNNLEWCTPKQNVCHALRHGLLPSGENAHRSKLTANEVLEIRAKYIRGDADRGIVGLAKEYNISKSMVSLIVRNEKWKYLSGVSQ